jgi:beta-glucanase (GH16 family)
MKHDLNFTFNPMRAILVFLLLIVGSVAVNGQNYKLVWEDNFDGHSLDSSKWNVEQKIGVWNTGDNHELQYYRKENVTVGDDGSGNNCMIITAKKEDYNGYNYTSGRVNTKGKFAFRKGKLEASIKIPDLANGLWPAFWTLGYTPTGWPDCGEIDILEMGQAAGITAGKQNSFIGAHLFWGPYHRDYGKLYTASEDLSSGFYKQTVVWDENKIAVYLNDSSTPYFQMGITGSDVEEFRNFQDYIIFNLAVGGSVPGIYDQNGITASFPAKMYIDWVKLYQENDDISKDNLPLYGSFGIFEDNASVDMRMDLGYDLSASWSGLTERSGETPQSGSRVVSFDTKAGQDYSLKLTAGLIRNMSNYDKGSIQFYMKTNLTGDIRLGVADSTGKETFVTFTDGSEKNIVRDGKWQPVSLRLADIAGEVNLAALKDMLIIKGNSDAAGYLSIDEVIASETAPVEGVYGIYTNNPLITDKFSIDNVTGFLYNWSNTVSFTTSIPAYEGTDVLSFRSSGAANWWGFGIFSSNPLNFEYYAKGYLHFSLRTKSTELFKVTVNGANDTKADITFTNGSDPYGFIRDGKWHQISAPVSGLVAQGLKLSACGNIFTMSGGAISDIGADDIYLSLSEDPVENSAICYPVSISISPKNPTIKTGAKKKFTASATNQFGKPVDASVTWESNGGTILQDGNFSATEPGLYTVIARMDELVDSTTITVGTTSNITNADNKIKVACSKQTGTVTIEGIEEGDMVELYSITGARIFSGKSGNNNMKIYVGNQPNSAYLLKITTKEKSFNWKLSIMQ